MFRRRRRDRDESEELLDVESAADEGDETDELDEDDLDEQDVAEQSRDEQSGDDPVLAEPGPTIGPWDVADVPHDALARRDLGGLLVPTADLGEPLLEGPGDGTLTAVVLRDGASALQIAAFAAPRRSGIWAEIRAEIAEGLRGSGGSADEVDGPFGTELRAKVPGEVSGQGRVLQAARFVGVDGPRWFVRGLFSGSAATDPAQAGPLEEAFRQTVVVRGKEAMAPRDPLPLRHSRDTLDGAQAAARPQLDRLERGPEIAETR